MILNEKKVTRWGKEHELESDLVRSLHFRLSCHRCSKWYIWRWFPGNWLKIVLLGHREVHKDKGWRIKSLCCLFWRRFFPDWWTCESFIIQFLQKKYLESKIEAYFTIMYQTSNESPDLNQIILTYPSQKIFYRLK